MVVDPLVGRADGLASFGVGPPPNQTLHLTGAA
jgi:hypothetical protein